MTNYSLDIDNVRSWNGKTLFLDFIYVGDLANPEDIRFYEWVPTKSYFGEDEIIEINLTSLGTHYFIPHPEFKLAECGCASWTEWELLPSFHDGKPVWGIKANSSTTDLTDPELNIRVDGERNEESFRYQQQIRKLSRKLAEEKERRATETTEMTEPMSKSEKTAAASYVSLDPNAGNIDPTPDKPTVLGPREVPRYDDPYYNNNGQQQRYFGSNQNPRFQEQNPNNGKPYGNPSGGQFNNDAGPRPRNPNFAANLRNEGHKEAMNNFTEMLALIMPLRQQQMQQQEMDTTPAGPVPAFKPRKQSKKNSKRRKQHTATESSDFDPDSESEQSSSSPDATGRKRRKHGNKRRSQNRTDRHRTAHQNVPTATIGTPDSSRDGASGYTPQMIRSYPKAPNFTNQQQYPMMNNQYGTTQHPFQMIQPMNHPNEAGMTGGYLSNNYPVRNVQEMPPPGSGHTPLRNQAQGRTPHSFPPP